MRCRLGFHRWRCIAASPLIVLLMFRCDRCGKIEERGPGL